MFKTYHGESYDIRSHSVGIYNTVVARIYGVILVVFECNKSLWNNIKYIFTQKLYENQFSTYYVVWKFFGNSFVMNFPEVGRTLKEFQNVD